jgi:hypothetical protein
VALPFILGKNLCSLPLVEILFVSEPNPIILLLKLMSSSHFPEKGQREG